MRFNVNREQIENNNEKRDYTTPYEKLLDPNRLDERSKQVEFLKSNKVFLIMGIYPDDMDHEFFVGCMEIYQSTGVNYFYDYEKLFRYNQHTVIYKGIKNYGCSYSGFPIDETDVEYLNSYKNKVAETIEIMKFFGIESIYGTSIEQLIEYYNNAENEWHELICKKLEKRKVKAKASIDKMRNDYFNFDDFDNNKFNNIFKECTKDMDMGKNLYTLDEVINININLDANKTFIVFLRKNDKVCFVGRTTNLLNYIGLKSKEYDADRVAFYPIDNNYIDDIYIRYLIQFDIPSGQVRNTNRKYISLTSAKRIFKELYKINLVHIKKIISKYDLERFPIGDTVVLDKIELDKAIRDYLSL